MHLISYYPNKKNLFRLSTLYTSFVQKDNNNNKKKPLIHQSQNVNDFFSKNKLKDVNDNDNNNNDNKEDNLTISKRFNKIYTKKKQGLNEVIPIKEEENESIK